jgi:(p)ppGpp synthase/HD superfamily hydrolase
MYDGGSEDEAIAALLHDALEDAPENISPEAIREHFGNKVLNIIRISTDTAEDFAGGQKEPWRVRKERYIEDITKTDPSLLRVTVADKVDNARAILRDLERVGDKVWERFNAGKRDQQWYYESTLKAYKTVGFQGCLLDELEKLVEQILAA